MSATSSVRRLREPGGGGSRGKVASTAMVTRSSSRSVTPLSGKLISGGETNKLSTGKENPSRPTSRPRAASQKPAIRPMPRIGKAASACGTEGQEARVRRSTSSAPRGRCSSPSEFNRVLSDMRKTSYNTNSRVSKDPVHKGSGTGLSGEIDRSAESSSGKFVPGSTRVSERLQQKKNNSFRDSNGTGVRVLKESKDSGKVNEIPKDSLFNTQEVKFSSVSDKSCFVGHNYLDQDVKVSDSVDSNRRSCVASRSNNDDVEKCGNVGGGFGQKESGAKSSYRLSGGLGISKDKGASEEGVVGKAINKYPSKLHEKLAFLEGKVKRIASDIKRTKEMLDMNNSDASKVILSDIQEKISGIEKVMGQAADGSDGKMGLSKSTESDNMHIDVLENSPHKQANHVKGSVKVLNTRELEARFFPHDKLLRDRTSLKTLSGSSESHGPKSVESTSDLILEEKSSSPIDENPIALEFLASLNEEQYKLVARGGDIGLECREVHEMEASANLDAHNISKMSSEEGGIELTTTETFDEFDDQENVLAMEIEEESEDGPINQLNEIGCKTSTAGWFVSEGESVLLAHDDSSCSFYDIANSEEKAVYKPPVGVSSNMWKDCWMIRAPGADGCSGRYVVAASAGNAVDSGFCSWDFYTKDVRAFHIEDGMTNSRAALSPLPNNTLYRRNAMSTTVAPENRQWWYKPCGPLLISGASSRRIVQVYDIRDGEQIMKWEVQKPVLAMDYSSPLQWRNRGKVVVAEVEAISLWDVSALNSQALLSVSSFGGKISALHVNNTDAELGGGVRQRVSSSEAEGNDGVFCTPDSINVLDFRNPSGIGLKISKLSVNVHSVYSRGDSIFLGCSSLTSAGKKQSCSQVQQFSLRKQTIFSTYTLPESNAHPHYTEITQVWGNFNLVMGVCGVGLFVFDALKEDGLDSFTMDYNNMQKASEIIAPDDLYTPSFDYLSSRVLLISKDRPAMWRYLS